jgi:hypothetical protein
LRRLHFLLSQDPEQNYFFFLYIVLFISHGFMAALAVFYFPLLPSKAGNGGTQRELRYIRDDGLLEDEDADGEKKGKIYTYIYIHYWDDNWFLLDL